MRAVAREIGAKESPTHSGLVARVIAWLAGNILLGALWAYPLFPAVGIVVGILDGQLVPSNVYRDGAYLAILYCLWAAVATAGTILTAYRFNRWCKVKLSAISPSVVITTGVVFFVTPIAWFYLVIF